MVSLRRRNNDSKGLYFAFLVWFGSSLQATRAIVLSKGKKKYHGLQYLVTPSTCQLSHLWENFFCCGNYVFFIIGNADIRVQDQRHSRSNIDDKITSNTLMQCLGW